MWIAGKVLSQLGLDAGQQSLISLALKIGADLCFFSYTSPIQEIRPGSGDMASLIKRAHACGLTCGVTVDGPFERAVRDQGFTEVMHLFYKGDALEECLQHYTDGAAEEVAGAVKAGADLVMVCDDIAYKKGLYFSPRMFEVFILPHYRKLKHLVSGEALLGFHSDGNIEQVISYLCQAGYRVFSLEPEAMDLVGLKNSLPRGTAVMSGIKADWLLDSCRGVEDGEIFTYIAALAAGGGTILTSCCGVNDAGGLEKLERIYRLADRLPGWQR